MISNSHSIISIKYYMKAFNNKTDISTDFVDALKLEEIC